MKEYKTTVPNFPAFKLSCHYITAAILPSNRFHFLSVNFACVGFKSEVSRNVMSACIHENAPFWLNGYP